MMAMIQPHDGTTGEDEALDCLDFTEALLNETYTLPAQINEQVEED